MGILYNSPEVVNVNPVQKAIDIIQKLSDEKLYATLYLLELIAVGDLKSESEDILALKSFEMNCKEEEATPDEMSQICESEAEIKAGFGIKAEGKKIIYDIFKLWEALVSMLTGFFNEFGKVQNLAPETS